MYYPMQKFYESILDNETNLKTCDLSRETCCNNHDQIAAEHIKMRYSDLMMNDLSHFPNRGLNF